MNKLIKINDNTYELIKNYRDAFDEEEFLCKFTDYFYDYDYIVGDIAYGKLRLKGFCKETNKKVNKINNFKNIDKYLNNYCANDCKHFILEKERKEKNEI